MRIKKKQNLFEFFKNYANVHLETGTGTFLLSPYTE